MWWIQDANDSTKGMHLIQSYSTIKQTVVCSPVQTLTKEL